MATRIPINKDSYNFEDRQKKIWEDMEKDMEMRRREWEDEIDKMRKEFFLLNPEKAEFHSIEGPRTARAPARIAEVDDGKPIIEKDDKGLPVFKVRFNMKDYKPEEVNVKMDSTKIMVSAKHEEKGTGSSVSREYNREVNIPRDVDPLALSCTLDPDGYLVFHAPLPAPNYSAIRDSAGSHNPSNVVKSTSSYQTSSTSSSAPKPQPVVNVAQTPLYSQRDQQHHHNQQQQQQQTRTHSVNHQPPHQQSSITTTSSKQQSVHPPQPTSFSHQESLDHPDHVVPTYKAPPDLTKFDMLDKIAPLPTPQFQTQLHSAAPPSMPNTSGLSQMPPFGHSAPPPTMPSASSLSQLPPFGHIGSTFPTGPISSQAQLSTPVVTSHDGKFQLTMPIDDFKPEELTVKTQDGKVIICAKRQITTGNRNQTTEMSREHSLPDNVDPLTIKAFFTDTNKLIVEAPFTRS